ncbi:L,D-transpeptidase [Marinoscillum luteum]|uniref:L,D-transpeptidase n=1 Tax=Marinoscillum luteum TaxID=861051 RepID=A0ABW7NA93_9BACT
MTEEIVPEIPVTVDRRKRVLTWAGYGLLTFILLLTLPWLIEKSTLAILSSPPANEMEEAAVSDLTLQLQSDLEKLEKKLAGKTPKGAYMIVNTAANTFALYKGSELIHADKCSTGSYILLKNGDNQQWMFKTPKGEFKIRSRTVAPVWKKPDWAFVEDGLPIPSMNHSSRFEYGVLGDYALGLGDGYLIHGTLYQRFLGLPVTHGCIRLNDANLKLAYESLKTGSKVYIY